MFLHTLVVFNLMYSTTTSFSNCPSVCSCSSRSGISSLICKGANLTRIPVVIEGKESMMVIKLNMNGNYLTKLLDFEFYNAGFKNVEILSMRNSNVKNMGEKLFYKLPNLQSLDLSNNLISHLHSKVKLHNSTFFQ